MKLQSRFPCDSTLTSRAEAQSLIQRKTEEVEHTGDEIAFDIQGNSFKSTLFPTATYAHELDRNKEARALREKSHQTAMSLHKAYKSQLPSLTT